MKLAIVTPTWIPNQKRAQFAEKALGSLREALGNTYPHIVVDSLPKAKSPYRGMGRAIYDKPNITYIQYPEQLFGSLALLPAVREAQNQGADLCFIHLDDDVYVPELRPLLAHSCDAFGRNEGLAQIRLIGYPISDKYCTAELGNRTQLTITADGVSFPGVCLKSDRQPDYTLWSTPFRDGVLESRCWPIVLWLSVYRTEALEKLLTRAIAHEHTELGRTELYYREKDNWPQLWLSQKLGFINMQFGGGEMHRNPKRWQELISFPNIEVR